jgi:nucleoside phosphorylase
MNLLVFAHRGEAQEFIHNFKLKACQHQEGLYLSASLSVFISGEGELNVFTRLGQILARFENLKSVVNMGIAGSLNHKFTLEGIYPIKMIKAYRYDEIEFQTLETQNEKGEELVSTHKRVLDDDFATLLKPYGDIVDREAWAIGLICKKQKIPFYCYKLISDYAGSTTQCFDIKERALYLSNLLYEYYLEQLHTQKKSEELEEIKEITHPLLHISFSQKKEILKHLKSIALTEEKSIQEVWEDLDLYQYHEEENPKKKN